VCHLDRMRERKLRQQIGYFENSSRLVTQAAPWSAWIAMTRHVE
jgi:hypothetical protein